MALSTDENVRCLINGRGRLYFSIRHHPVC